MAMIDKEIQLLMLKGEKGDPGIAGDYNELTNKPKINGVELLGNKTASDLGLASEADLNAVISDIGGLSNLNTTVKSSLVAAINEVNADTFSKNIEYGTWTPTVINTLGDPVPHTISTFSETLGRYYRVGALVYVVFELHVTSIDVSGLSNTQAAVGGLPYPADPMYSQGSTAPHTNRNSMFIFNATRSSSMQQGFISPLNFLNARANVFQTPSTSLYLIDILQTGSVNWVTMTEASGNWGSLYGSGVYYATI